MERRKRLRLEHYDYSRDGAYFVTVCTKERTCTLGTVVGADVLIGPYTELSGYGKIVDDCIRQMPAVEKYVIMPNHIHLLVRLENGPVRTPAPTDGEAGNELGPERRSAQTLPMTLRWLKRETTQRCGVPLWQRSYYDHVVRDDADYQTKWNHIDTNPAQWAEDEYNDKRRNMYEDHHLTGKHCL